MALHHVVTGLCFFLRLRNIFLLEFGGHEKTDILFANLPILWCKLAILSRLFSWHGWLLNPGSAQLLLQESCWNFPYRSSPILPLPPSSHLVAAVSDTSSLIGMVYQVQLCIFLHGWAPEDTLQRLLYCSHDALMLSNSWSGTNPSMHLPICLPFLNLTLTLPK